jgi:hypothetical protein
VAPGGDAEFNHWHTREHVPERVGVPGFLRGRRYAAVRGEPAYFTLYETESPATLASPAYLARLDDPTPWTRRNLPLFRHSRRTACRVSLTLGQGLGGVLATLECGPRPEREAELRAWLTGTALPAAADRPGIVGAHLCEADLEATSAKERTREGALHQVQEPARWVVLVEGLDADTVEVACAQLLEPDHLALHGAEGATRLAVYRLTYCLSR